jgi:hypothetical protein
MNDNGLNEHTIYYYYYYYYTHSLTPSLTHITRPSISIYLSLISLNLSILYLHTIATTNTTIIERTNDRMNE